ncbi:MAG: DUF4416 family protein [Candidatus Binatia bacterium]
MGTPTPPRPVKLLVALLAKDPELFSRATTALESSHGTADLESEVFSWTPTTYYQKEMGDHLLRKFVAFPSLITPEAITQIKQETNSLEISFSEGGSPTSPRRVNLDPGYIDATKLVLASTKPQAHRIYLNDGIYAEVTLLYHHGQFHPFLYTYADYRWPGTQKFLHRVRVRYLTQLRDHGSRRE